MKDTKIYKAIRNFLDVLRPKYWLPKLKASKLGQSYIKHVETLKPMTWKERIEFLWTYYKDVVLFVGLLMMIPIVIISTYINKKDVLIGGKFVNLDVRKAGLSYITDDLFVHMGGDAKKEEIQVGSLVFEEFSAQPEYNYNAAMSVFGAIDADVLDYMFTDTYALEFYMGDLIYMDLNRIFSKDELAAMEEDLIYLQDDITWEKVPVAINVTDMPFVKDCVYVKEDDAAFLVFVGPFEEAGQYHDFWEYLMAWEGMPEEAN